VAARAGTGYRGNGAYTRWLGSLPRLLVHLQYNLKAVPATILLVDDHTIVSDGLKALLADEPAYEVKGVAVNGRMAIDMLRLLKVDIVLMDIDMPEMNGIDAARIIRKEMPEKKIIMLTMHDEKAMIRMMLDMGADGYLLKNSTKAELLQALADVLEEKKYISAEANSVLLRPDEKEDRNGRLAELTEREIEIIRLVAEGLSNKEIGERLFISHRTVDTHRTNLMNKLGLHNVAGIVKFAIVNGLVKD
jgi:DNA-binding NarL/FixJ family response regulator